MIKGILTYIKTFSLLPGLLGILLLTSCGFEPHVNTSKKDIEQYLLSQCDFEKWYDIDRQGSFQTYQDGRHRIYRCYVEVEINQQCTIPGEVVNGSINPDVPFLYLKPGRQEFSAYLDYLETNDGWQLQKVITSDDVEFNEWK